MVEVYKLKLNRSIRKEEYDKLVKFLDSEKQDQLRRFRFDQDRDRGLFGDLLVRYIINQRTGIGMGQGSYCRNTYGKPYIKELPNIHYNISHSGEWIVAAFHNQPIGIDVEAVKVHKLEIAQRYFTKDEYQLICRQEPKKQHECFYLLWTIKESYVKALGQGLSIPLNSFNVSLTDKVIIGTNRRKWFFNEYEIDIGYRMAVCSNTRDFPSQVTPISIDEIIGRCYECLEK